MFDGKEVLTVSRGFLKMRLPNRESEELSPV